MKLATALLYATLAVCTFACAGACGQRASDPPAENPSTAEPPAAEPKPDTELCNGERCDPPQQCIRYSGIAGPSIPLFTCGIPCAPDGTCPNGKTCQAIPDGPRLCR